MDIKLENELYDFALKWKTSFEDTVDYTARERKGLVLKYKYLQSVFPNTDLVLQLKKKNWWVDSMKQCLE